MKPLLIILAILLLYIILQALYSGYYFYKSRSLSKKVYVGNYTFGDKGPSYSLFVAGDSVGAGVGATSFETSLAGRLARELSKTKRVNVTNKSVSGYRMHNLVSGPIPDEKQNLVLLVISSNDVFNFVNLRDFKESTSKVISRYSKLGDKVIIIGPGRIFDTDALPFFMRPVYKYFGTKYAEIISNQASSYPNVIYVNPYAAAPLGKRYGYTGASDKFHPNDEGYRFWFDLVMNKFKD
ncbi:MAG TPA: SGNH/GDSL hydrolase family protein [Patescibacteria group bacterium]|nr:SGNH/GDSL hydrolase family protein [Patescibacteria group bacterium]